MLMYWKKCGGCDDQEEKHLYVQSVKVQFVGNVGWNEC